MVPTSIRLKTAELDELKDAAGFSGLSVSEFARRAILVYLGISSRDVGRRDTGALVAELGRIRQNLARIGTLLRLAAATGQPSMAETEEQLQLVIGELVSAVTVLIRRDG